MFRASPWISYEPPQRQTPNRTNSNDSASHDSSYDLYTAGGEMDAPEISTLREEDEETPPPDSGGLSFSKFRVNLRLPARGRNAAASGSVVGPPVGPPSAGHRAPSPPDSDDEDEEDQLMDDDELAIVTETGRGPIDSPSGSLAVVESPASTTSPRKRGGATRGRQRRGGPGRRGRPGREPPDAAAMMSTFELTKTDEPGHSSSQIIPPISVLVGPPPQTAGPSTGDWSSAAPPKPPRKKPGPKKGSTLGPRGPRKATSKTAQNTPGTSTPVLDDPLIPIEPFLIPAPPSIPPTPGSEQPPLPPPHLPPIQPPDFTLDSSIPIPTYPLPTRSFPVQAPPKIPSGYATTHPIDTGRGPVRKWNVVQREIKGIAGGRWFTRSWVGERDRDADLLWIKPLAPPGASQASNTIQTSLASAPPRGRESPGSSSRPPIRPVLESGPSRVSAAGSSSRSRASSVKVETGVHVSDSDPPQPAQPMLPSSKGPGSPRTRTSASSSPPLRAGSVDLHGPP